MLNDYSGPGFPSLEALQAAQLKALVDELPEGIQKALAPGQTVTFVLCCGETNKHIVGFGEVLEPKEGYCPLHRDVFVRLPNNEPAGKRTVPAACLTPICMQDYKVAESLGWDVSEFVDTLPEGATSFLDTMMLRWHMDSIGELDKIDSVLKRIESEPPSKD